MTSTARSTDSSDEQIALIVSELTLVAVSLAVIVGFERLFLDDTWRRPIIVVALLAHGLAMAARRFRLPIELAAPAFIAVGVIAITHLNYGSTTRRWLPSGSTVDLLRDDLGVVRDIFPTAIAPTPAITGFVVLAAAVVWVLVGVADTLAFRFRLTLPALGPAAGIVIFLAALGSESRRTPLLLLALTAAIVFIVTHRSMMFPTEHTWLGNVTDARSAVARFAAPVAIVTGLLTVATLPLVPGATDSLVDFDTAGPGDPARVVISPLVDIRGRIVSQADVELFQVISRVPAYWRLTSLDTFDGSVWSSRADYDNASGDLAGGVQSGNSTNAVSQQFRIEALAAVWLPAAFQPTSIDNNSDAGLSWEPDSATLIVDRSRAISDGIEYTVESALPEFSAASLAQLPFGYPDEFERLTELPDEFSPLARGLAVDITRGATTPYEMSLQLQQWFRNGFSYNINVAVGHDDGRVETFLTNREGYCEQFAGTFAAMARSLGLPARVAVGFTWGDVDDVNPELYRVRGEHAHAWPEIYIEGAGWVAFEPTPGRGAPNASYTNLPAEQDETGVSPDFQGADLNQAFLGIPESILDQDLRGEDLAGLAAGTGGPALSDSSFRVPGWLIVVGSILLTVAALLAIVPFGRRRFRNRRTSHSDPARQRVLHAWESVIDAVAPLGIRPNLAETSAEFAGRVVPVLGPRSDLDHLAGSVDRARYSLSPLNDAVVKQAESTQEAIKAQVQRRTTRWERYRAEFQFASLARRT